jgi:hypothetical protein
MPRGTNQSYRTKQKRTASKLEQRVKPKHRSTSTAKGVTGVTVNKRTGGRKQRTSK